MLIFIVDDEKLPLAEAERAVRGAAPEAEVVTFSSAQGTLDRVTAGGCRPDVVFTDICMPDTRWRLLPSTRRARSSSL